jgi:hypothetical protein
MTLHISARGPTGRAISMLARCSSVRNGVALTITNVSLGEIETEILQPLISLPQWLTLE